MKADGPGSPPTWYPQAMHDHCDKSAEELFEEIIGRLRRRDRLHRRIDHRLDELQEALHMAGKTASELLELMRQERTMDGSILVLLRDLKAKVDAAKGNQAAIDTAFAETQADMVSKAEAIIENTPEAQP